MKFLIFFIVLSSAHASDSVSYEIGSSTVVFHKEDSFLVNRSCEKKCEAYKLALKHKDQQVLPQDRMGGKNPSSVKCTKYMGGDVVIGQDSAGNQQSFCLFSDKSYLLNQ